MPFVLVKYAVVFCSVAILLALLADLAFLLTLLIVSHFTGGGVGILLRRNGWIGVLAVWWVTSFLISLPILSRFTRLPLHFF
jgi:hypothetical protein